MSIPYIGATDLHGTTRISVFLIIIALILTLAIIRFLMNIFSG